MIDLKGIVVSGKHLGQKIGFPTANLDVVCGKVPAVGVYVVRVDVRGTWYYGMMNIGVAADVRDKSGGCGCASSGVDNGSSSVRSSGGMSVDDYSGGFCSGGDT
ncbi:MAG: riboflavin kinase, partial [Bacteroidales bacterium]|nr:riboflavin kinase [Bacteroidales bacterium]